MEPTDNSSRSPKGRGLLVVGLSPQPDHPARAPEDHSLQGHILPCCWCEAEGQSLSLAVPGEKVEGRKGLSEKSYQLLMGRTGGKAAQRPTASERGVATAGVWPRVEGEGVRTAVEESERTWHVTQG